MASSPRLVNGAAAWSLPNAGLCAFTEEWYAREDSNFGAPRFAISLMSAFSALGDPPRLLEK